MNVHNMFNCIISALNLITLYISLLTHWCKLGETNDDNKLDNLSTVKLAYDAL